MRRRSSAYWFLPFYICTTVNDALYIEKWKPAVIEAVLLRNYLWNLRISISRIRMYTCVRTKAWELHVQVHHQARWIGERRLGFIPSYAKVQMFKTAESSTHRSSRKSQAARMYVLVLYIQVQIGDAFWSTSGEKEKKKKQKKPSWRVSTSYPFRQFEGPHTEHALSSIIFIN